MPDARSGNSNGRTQGGSNAEIVIADAVKGLEGIDYELRSASHAERCKLSAPATAMKRKGVAD